MIRKMQVFAGDRNSGLILKNNGALYAFGANFDCRFGENALSDIPFERAYPLAYNVKHAALGGTCTIYVTKNGDVELIGNGELKKRFHGFSGAKRVFASPADIYLIEGEDGRYYAFGQNNRRLEMHPDFDFHSRIVKQEEKEVIRWEVLTHELECAKEDSDTRENVDLMCRSDAHSGIRKMDVYFELVKQYGKENVRVYVDRKEDTLLSAYYKKKLFRTQIIEKRKWVYEAWITIENNLIFEPVPYTLEEFKESVVYTGCIYGAKFEEYVGDLSNVKKAARFNYDMAVLSGANELWLHCNGKAKCKSLTHIMDVSACQDSILIAKNSGEILHGTGNVKKLLQRADESLFRSNRELAVSDDEV